MPSEAPAREIVMMSLSTVAGASAASGGDGRAGRGKLRRGGPRDRQPGGRLRARRLGRVEDRQHLVSGRNRAGAGHDDLARALAGRQIALPGGKVDPGDADATAAALRDAAHAAARAEVEFLRSLLPEAEATQ